jgi:hypothetical protein
MEDDTEQTGQNPIGKPRNGSDPPPSDHEVINIGTLAISYSPSETITSQILWMDRESLSEVPKEKWSIMIEEVGAGSPPTVLIIGDHEELKKKQ